MEPTARYQEQRTSFDRRARERRQVRAAGRLVWRDARGTTRFATVRTRDLGGDWLFVECLSGAPIPLYRLVHLQLDLSPQDPADIPDVLQQGKVRCAVYRVGTVQPATGAPEGYALRLLVHPARNQDPPARDDRDEASIARRLPAFIAARSIA